VAERFFVVAFRGCCGPQLLLLIATIQSQASTSSKHFNSLSLPFIFLFINNAVKGKTPSQVLANGI